MKRLYILFLGLVLVSCQSDKKTKNETTAVETAEKLTGDMVVNKAISSAGLDKLNRSGIRFEFREMEYRAMRNNGRFELLRLFSEDGKAIKDILTNDGFERFVNQERQILADSMVAKYTASVNSVHYFSVLPFGLNDGAVNKTLLTDETIKGQDYFRVKVTFDEDGGGEDFDDEFVYWFNTENFELDYFAYSYAEDDGRGFRFREVFNERTVEGIRFVDYKNYKPKSEDIALESLGQLFKDKQLDLLSKIELENVEVRLIDNL
ncbi:deoxyribose-phosphate aldolase [Winogradskyella maritima]|uniref:DUF6503 family protein n=1 Tax=Winogradskyella maritima TaxID=1517766 RepID=A0ABV8AE76_9FLAO|nr:deoxyribose-phosphate aldolase [Winogradskyella maritima]